MKKTAILLMLVIMFSGCKKNGYYDTGAIMVDESLISDTFRQGNIYSENNYIAKR